MLMPNWFRCSKEYKASVIIHELFHDFFRDHKAEYFGGKVDAYGKNATSVLAKQEPKKARRNATNYQQFCLELWSEKKFA